MDHKTSVTLIACDQVEHRTAPTVVSARVVVGAAAAYAAIEYSSPDSRGSVDIRLIGGRSAAQSLRESAAELREHAARDLQMAAIMLAAADLIGSAP